MWMQYWSSPLLHGLRFYTYDARPVMGIYRVGMVLLNEDDMLNVLNGKRTKKSTFIPNKVGQSRCTWSVLAWTGY